MAALPGVRNLEREELLQVQSDFGPQWIHADLSPWLGYSPAISGVARHANLIGYDVCNGGCAGAATLAGSNQAVLGDVDVHIVSDHTWVGDLIFTLFSDGFESGGLGVWSSSTP